MAPAGLPLLTCAWPDGAGHRPAYRPPPAAAVFAAGSAGASAASPAPRRIYSARAARNRGFPAPPRSADRHLTVSAAFAPPRGKSLLCRSTSARNSFAEAPCAPLCCANGAESASAPADIALLIGLLGLRQLAVEQRIGRLLTTGRRGVAAEVRGPAQILRRGLGSRRCAGRYSPCPPAHRHPWGLVCNTSSNCCFAAAVLPLLRLA